MPKNFGRFERSSSGDIELRGKSVVEGASASKTRSSAHLFWYRLSSATRVSRLSVYYPMLERCFHWTARLTHVLDFQGILRTVGRVESIESGLRSRHDGRYEQESGQSDKESSTPLVCVVSGLFEIKVRIYSAGCTIGMLAVR